METFVNLEPKLSPSDLISVEGEVPDAVRIERLDPATLPKNWHRTRDEFTRQFGDAWIRGNEAVALLVPSAAIGGELNLLLNPTRPEFGRIHFGSPQAFEFDMRMFR